MWGTGLLAHKQVFLGIVWEGPTFTGSYLPYHREEWDSELENGDRSLWYKGDGGF